MRLNLGRVLKRRKSIVLERSLRYLNEKHEKMGATITRYPLNRPYINNLLDRKLILIQFVQSELHDDRLNKKSNKHPAIKHHKYES